MISPKKFAKEVGFSYAQVKKMCFEGKIKCEFTPKGQAQIHESELKRFKNPYGFVSLEEYNEVIKERDNYKAILSNLKNTIAAQLENTSN